MGNTANRIATARQVQPHPTRAGCHGPEGGPQQALQQAKGAVGEQGDEGGGAEDDAEKREERPELVREDFARAARHSHQDEAHDRISCRNVCR